MGDTAAADGIGLERGRAVLAAQPFAMALGARLDELRPGFAQIRVPIGERSRQHMGIAHGGLIAFLVDATTTFAAGSLAGEAVRTAELKLNYVSAATGTAALARAEVAHRGSRLIVARCDVFDCRGGRDVLCALGQATISAPV